MSKRPILLATTTISIGLGVGINVAVSSALHTVLFEPWLSAAAPASLFVLEPGLSYPNYRDIRMADAFVDLAVMQTTTLSYRTSDATMTVSAQVVSDNFFKVLGIRPLLGRTFDTAGNAESNRDSSQVVISYGFWRRLGGNAGIIGETVSLNGWPYAIGGVLPDHAYSTVGPLLSPSIYVPADSHVSGALDARGAAQFDAIGRLRNGMTLREAAAALTPVAQDLERRFPKPNERLTQTLTLTPLRGFIYRLPGSARRVVFTLAAALYMIVGLIVLVTSANVASLLLARAAERSNEIAVRIALGATRARLVRLFLAESFIVAALGSVAGTGLWMLVRAIVPKISAVANAGVDLIPASLPLLQCGLLIVLVTLACGIGPGLIARRVTSSIGFRATKADFGAGRWNFRQTLVAGQVAVAFILQVGGCALLFTMVRQHFADRGFDVAHTVSIQMRVPPATQVPTFFTMREAIATMPGIESVSIGDLPVGLVGFERVQEPDAPTSAGYSAQINRVGPNYLHTLGIQVLRGRDFRDDDIHSRVGPTPVVVGETFARRYLGSVDVIGRRLALPRDRENGREATPLQIVGVSADGALRPFGGERTAVIYFPAVAPSMVVRVSGSAAAVARELERTVANLAPSAAVTATPMTTRLSEVMLPVRIATFLLTLLGVVSLLLAITGLYGAVSYAISRRRFEIGLRMALGASSGAIVRLMIRDTVLMVGVGSLVGGGLSLGLIRVLWPLLAGDHTPVTPLALAVVFTLTLAIGITAALRPILAAAAVGPMDAIRQD